MFLRLYMTEATGNIVAVAMELEQENKLISFLFITAFRTRNSVGFVLLFSKETHYELQNKISHRIVTNVKFDISLSHCSNPKNPLILLLLK